MNFIYDKYFIITIENLAIYECSVEDFALCTYVCQSKTEVSQIIKKGVELALIVKKGGNNEEKR